MSTHGKTIILPFARWFLDFAAIMQFQPTLCILLPSGLERAHQQPADRSASLGSDGTMELPKRRERKGVCRLGRQWYPVVQSFPAGIVDRFFAIMYFINLHDVSLSWSTASSVYVGHHWPKRSVDGMKGMDMASSENRLQLMVDGSWWFLMVLDGSWWF